MTQLIYAVGALALLTLFSVGMQRAGLSGERDMYTTEARTRMLGIARETVELISRQDIPFDNMTDPERGAAEEVFPYVADASGLTPTASFGGCAGYLTNCLDVDDFHGFSVADSVEGIPVTLEFEVSYINELTGEESVAPTFAKRLRVKVSTISMFHKNEPLEVTYSRVFAYPNTIDFARGIASRGISL